MTNNPFENMPTEQIPLNFETPETPPDELETLDILELEERFKKATGYDPRARFLKESRWGDRKALLIRGIRKPAEGKDLVAEYDHEDEGVGDAWSGK